MHKFEGITLVVYKIGQPRSEALAALERAMLDDLFPSTVIHSADGEEGYGVTLNTLEEAERLSTEVVEAEVGLSTALAGGQYDKGWAVH